MRVRALRIEMSLQLQRPNASFVTFTNGANELFWSQPSTAFYRIGGQFDASMLTTGVYNYTAIVKSRWTLHGPDSGTVTQTTVAVKVLIVNGRNGSYGTGWSVAGLHRLRFPVAPDTLTILDTNGSGGIVRFTQASKNAVAVPAAADYTTITTTLSGSTVTGYKRIFPSGDTLFYSSTGYLILSKNRLGDSTRFHYNASSLLDSIIDPAGKAVKLLYTGNGLFSITDPGGRVTMFNIAAVGGDMQNITDATGTIAFAGTYDASHRLTQAIDRSGTNTWLSRYDFAGKLASDSTPAVWADSTTARIGGRYHSLQSAFLIDPASGKGTAANAATPVLEDSIRVAVVSPSGDSVRYALDRYGAPTITDMPNQKTTIVTARNPDGTVYHSITTARGRVVSTIWTWWVNGQVITTTDSITNATIVYTYDSKYGLLTDVGGNTTPVKNFLNLAKSWVDSTRTGTCGACTDSVTRYSHESHGRLNKLIDPQLDTTVYTFDTASAGFKNLLSTRQGPHTTTLRYDGYGRAVRVINARGDSAIVSLDSLNRTRNVKGPQGSIVSYTYDPLFLRTVTDAKSQVYSYYRNALGWMDSVVNANTGDPAANRVDKYEYSKLGLTKAHINRRGQRTSMTYDQQGRLLTLNLAGGRVSNFAYDTAGLWAKAWNGESFDSIRTDSTGLWTVQYTKRGTHWFTDSSTVDITGLPQSFTVKGETSTLSAITYGYDSNRRLNSMTVDGKLTSFVHNRDGMLTSLSLPTSPQQTIGFSVTRGHEDYSVTYSKPPNTLYDQLAAYLNFDSLGRIRQRIKLRQDTTRSYAYDSVARLTNYQVLQDTSALSCLVDAAGFAGERCTSAHGEKVLSQTTFTYDSVGNPTDGGATVIAGNRLTAYNGYTLTYDYDGNLTHKHSSTFDQLLYWNSIGQLDSVKTGTSLVSYGYNAMGRRVRKTTATQSLRYIYAGSQMIAEIDSATNSAVRVYSYYGTEPPTA